MLFKKNILPDLTDLHCHILPGIDDGSKSVEMSVQMVQKEYEDGVRRIALTSHFDGNSGDLDAFLIARKEAFESLKEALQQSDFPMDEIKFKLGAEVMFSPKLLEYDVSPLCLEGTNVLLIELPTMYKPYYLTETMYSLVGKGYQLLLAHVERYDYLMNDLDLLTEWVENGILVQANSRSFVEKTEYRKQLIKMTKQGLVHVLSSDAHNMERRKPTLLEGITAINKKASKGKVLEMCSMAESIFEGSL